MKTKKYDIRGGALRLPKYNHGKSKFTKGVEGTGKFIKKFGKGWYDPHTKSKVAMGVRTLVEATFVPELYRIGKNLGKVTVRKAWRGLKGRTRSGKAKKTIRTEYGITNYNKFKNKVESSDANKSYYKDKIQKYTKLATDLKPDINTRGRFRKLISTDPFKLRTGYTGPGFLGYKWLAKKFSTELSSNKYKRKIAEEQAKLDTVEAKEAYMLNKWKGKIATHAKYSKQKPKINSILANNTKTLAQKFNSVKQIFEEEARIKKAEQLSSVTSLKTQLDEKKKQMTDAENTFKTATEDYYANPKDTKVKNTYIQAQKTLGEARTRLMPIIEHMDKFYREAKKKYIKISGKAQTLNNLGKRSHESLTKSLGRLFTIKPLGERFHTRTSYASTVLKSANNTPDTDQSQRYKNYLATYFSKDKKYRKEKLENYIILGKNKLDDLGKKRDKEGSQQKLIDIIKTSNIQSIDDIKNVKRSDFLAHLDSLKLAGSISSKEYETLQKFHKASRIQEFIKEKEGTEQPISDAIKSLSDITKIIGSTATIKGQTPYNWPKIYRYGTPIEDVHLINKDDPNTIKGISQVKLLSLLKYETDQDKVKLKSQIDTINNLKPKSIDNKIRKDNQIIALYTKYGIPIPTKMPDTVDITLFKDENIMKHIGSNSIIFENVRTQLETIFKDTKNNFDYTQFSKKLADATQNEGEFILKNKIGTGPGGDIPKNRESDVEQKLKNKTFTTVDGDNSQKLAIFEAKLNDKAENIEKLLQNTDPEQMDKLVRHGYINESLLEKDTDGTYKNKSLDEIKANLIINDTTLGKPDDITKLTDIEEQKTKIRDANTVNINNIDQKIKTDYEKQNLLLSKNPDLPRIDEEWGKFFNELGNEQKPTENVNVHISRIFNNFLSTLKTGRQAIPDSIDANGKIIPGRAEIVKFDDQTNLSTINQDLFDLQSLEKSKDAFKKLEELYTIQDIVGLAP